MFKKIQKVLLAVMLPTFFLAPFIIPQPAAAINVLSGPCPAGVATNGVNGAGTPSVCTDNQSGSGNNPLYGPDGIITKAVEILSVIVGVAAVAMIIVSGFRFVTSGGNPEATKSARTQLMYALVGIVVASLGVVIVEFVLHNVS